MLSNAVVLFLKDALPIVWSITLLLIIIERWQKWIVIGCAAGVALSYVVFVNLSWLSFQLEGQGYEFFQSLLLILSYFLAVGIFCTRRSGKKSMRLSVFATLLIIIIIILNMTNSFVFLSVSWQVSSQHNLLYLSLFLGFGISISISILTFLLLKPLSKTSFANYLLIIFAAGNLASTANLLQQTDMLTSVQIWNSNEFLSEQHEIGQFLTTTLGYESTPTILFLSMYIFSLLTAIGIRYLNRADHKNLKDNR